MSFAMLVVGGAFHLNRNLAAYLLQENGPFEIIGFVSCLAAAVLFAMTSARYARLGRKAAAFWSGLLAAGFFFLAMEEISWGQSFFQWSTPDLLSDNKQGETNLHNMAFVHLRAHDIGTTLIGLYFIVVPMMYFGMDAVRSLIDRMNLPVPPLALAAIVAACYVLFYIPFSINYLLSAGQPLNVGEMQEFIYEMCFFIFAYLEFTRARKLTR